MKVKMLVILLLVLTISSIATTNNLQPIKSTQHYNPIPEDRWVIKKPIPTPRTYAAATVVKGIIYVIGGKGEDDEPLPTVEAYDPKTDMWTTKTPMPTARYGLAAVSIEGIIYAIGGWNGLLHPDTHHYSTVEAYDPQKDTWTTKTPMPMAREYLSAAVVNDTIYAIGGYEKLANEAYSPLTDTWMTKTPIPGEEGTGKGRYHSTAVVVDNMIYVIDGHPKPDFNQVYDPLTDTWSARAPMPTSRFVCSGEYVGNGIYVIGGVVSDVYGIGHPVSTNEMYDPLSDEWLTDLAPMPTARYGFVSAAVNGTIYIISGYNGTSGYITSVNEGYIVYSENKQKPLAQLSASPTKVIQNVEEVIFDVSLSYDPDGSVVSYWYDYGDGSSSGWTNKSEQHKIYPEPGEYHARLKVKDDDGLISDWSSVIKISVNLNPGAPTADLLVSPTTVIEATQEVLFDASASYDRDGVIEAYFFRFGDGYESGWVSSPAVKWTYGECGEYCAQVKVKDNDQLISRWSEKVKVTVESHLGRSEHYGGGWFEEARSITQTDSGFAICGTTHSFGAGGSDFWLVKTDFLGKLQWSKPYGGASEEEAYSHQNNADGGYVIAGSTKSFGAGGSDFWLVKTDWAGNMQWNKTYGGAMDDCAKSIVQTSDGGYALAGYTDSFGPGDADFWLVKTDSNGNQEWNKTYGGADGDVAESMVQTSDGGYALTGYTSSYSQGETDFWTVKTDSSGNIEWTETYGYEDFEWANCIAETSDGGFILAGAQCSYPAGRWGRIAVLVKYSSSGSIQWRKYYPFSSWADIDEAYYVIEAQDGGYLVVGTTEDVGFGYLVRGGVLLFKTDSSGETEYFDVWGDYPDGGYSVVEIDRDEYAIAATAVSSGDFWLIKLFKQNPLAYMSASPIRVRLKNQDENAEVEFDASASYDPDGSVVSYWYDYGDGSSSGWTDESIHCISYAEPSEYCAKVKVKDDDGLESDWSPEVKITVTSKSTSIGNWTFMVYLDGDNDIEGEALRDLNEMEKVGSTSDVNILVLLDRHPEYDSSNGDWTGTRLYYVTKDDDTSTINSELIEDYGELNMGDNKTLSNFIRTVADNYPAERYALIIMNHGSGWQGICDDYTSKFEHLDMVELKEGLTNAGIYIDVLGFEACLMGMIEVGYQIRDYVEAMVASEDYIRGFPLFWHLFPYDMVLTELTNDPSMSGKELAEIFIEKFKEAYQTHVEFKQTLSAVDLTKIDDLVTSVNKLARSLPDEIGVYATQIENTRSLIGRSNEEYGKENLLDPQDDLDYIDLYYFAQLIKENINDEVIKNHAQNVMNGVNNTIFAEWHQALHPNSHGLSIYFPETKGQYLEDSYNKLEFTVGSENVWDDFLKEYLEKVSCKVFVGSKTSTIILYDTPFRVDDFGYKTPKLLGLFKDMHEFEAAPIFVNDRQILIFDYWEDETNVTVSEFPKFERDIQVDKWFWAVYKPLMSGTILKLTETQGKLYLHVYDPSDNHVGFNYELNQTEIDIPDAHYFDYLNGTTIIFIPRNVSSFKITIDARHSEQQTESYNLTINTIHDARLLDQMDVISTIDKGKTEGYDVNILSDGKLRVTPSSTSRWEGYWYIVIAIVIAGLCGFSYILLRRRKTSLKRSVPRNLDRLSRKTVEREAD